MKLGDSLGRSRRRRRKPEPAETPAAHGESLTLEQARAGASVDAPAGGGEGAGAPAADGGAHAADEGSPAAARASSAGGSAGGGRRSRAGLLGIVGRRFLLTLGALTATGWIVGYMVATTFVFPAPPPPGDLFEVPDLRGLGLASAGERLAGAGLEIGRVDSLRHPAVAAGLVLGQSPLAGQLSRPESPIRVTLSAGPETRSVPDVRRLDVERARVVLETIGFVVDVAVAESDEPRGRVIEVSPAPDSMVALPAEVRLVVSAGPPVVPMPLVLGLEQAAAEALLDSLGLVVSDVEEVFRFGRDQGIVVEQEPAADTDLQRGASVSLKVGRRGMESG